MLKTVVPLLLFLFLADAGQAQDGVFKLKKIHLRFDKIEQQDSLIALELYQQGVFEGRQCFSYDSTTGEYTLHYSLTGIGGGEKNYLRCPALLVRVTFLTKGGEKEDVYSRSIMIVLGICEKSELREINLPGIDLNKCINQPGKVIVVGEHKSYQIVERKDITPPLADQEPVKLQFSETCP